MFGVTSRKKHLVEIINASGIEMRELRNVLDFGGDLGQFFPEEIPGDKYLFDPSSPSTSFGEIQRIQNLDDLVGQIGLIMNSHTLEHLPGFKQVLANLGSLLSANGVVYVEVPVDAFRTHRFHSRNFYLVYLKIISRIPRLFILLDFLTGLYRTLFRRIPIWGIVKQSEHINYFSEFSLLNLANGTKFSVIQITKPDYNFGQGFIKLGRISMVLKKS